MLKVKNKGRVGVFIVKFEETSRNGLVSLLLTLSE